jgi:hypothetical protein
MHLMSSKVGVNEKERLPMELQPDGNGTLVATKSPNSARHAAARYAADVAQKLPASKHKKQHARELPEADLLPVLVEIHRSLEVARRGTGIL